MEKNELNSFDFFSEYIVHLVVVFIWYNSILFRCLPYMSCLKSRLILFLLVLFMLIMSRYVLYQSSSKWVVISSIILPFGIYTYWIYSNLMKSMKTIMFVCSLFSVLYSLLVMTQKIRRKKYKQKIILRRIKKSIFASATIFTIGFLVIMLPLLFRGTFNGSVIELNIKSVASKTDDATIKGNIEYLQNLKYEYWNKLTVKQRLEVMQCCADIECNYLGINEVQVVASNLEASVLGTYDLRYNIIKLKLDLIANGDGEDALDILLHECRHAYQYALIESYINADESSRKLLIYNRVPDLCQNFLDYYNGDDYEIYYNQACEEDSREYAEDRVEEYMRKIEEKVIE